MPKLVINPADWPKFKARKSIGVDLGAAGPLELLKLLDMPIGFDESIKPGEFRIDRHPAEPEEEEITGGLCPGCEIDHDPTKARVHPMTRRARLVCKVLRG